MKEQGAPSPTSAGICYSPAHRSCFPIQTSPWSFSTTRSPQRAWMGGGESIGDTLWETSTVPLWSHRIEYESRQQLTPSALSQEPGSNLSPNRDPT